MDAIEQWLRDHGHTLAADDWLDDPAPNPLIDFLDKIEGPTMIGLDPVIYPACINCSQAWMMRRVRGAWVWQPDCSHKNGSCKLVQG